MRPADDIHDPASVLHKLAEVRATLIKSITLDPDGVAGRDELWIEHERLLNERDGLA